MLGASLVAALLSHTAASLAQESSVAFTHGAAAWQERWGHPVPQLALWPAEGKLSAGWKLFWSQDGWARMGSLLPPKQHMSAVPCVWFEEGRKERPS